MLREKLIDRGLGDHKKFRWRSHEVSRTEGLSDAVFGFAITLLVVSPGSSADLQRADVCDARLWRFCDFLHAAFYRLVQPVQVLSAIRPARQRHDGA